MQDKGTIEDLFYSRPKECRTAIHRGQWNKTTAGLCPGYTQTNLVILPSKYAFDFLLFCQRNPKPCPLLEVLTAGESEPKQLAPGANIRTDLPRYRIFRQDFVEERDDISDIWSEDYVSFLLGCSFTFEDALMRTGVPVRHVEEGKNVPMYITNQLCEPAGEFQSNLVVTMRPIPANMVHRAVQITSRFPGVHGAPVHIGDPQALGISDLDHPDFGDRVSIYPGEIPVFWACGVTSQLAVQNAHPSLAISHSPGYMFITDQRDEDFSIL